jgi:hypothetical protein
VQIGVAHTTRFSLDQNLARTGFGNIQFLEYQRFAELFDNGSLHFGCHGLFLGCDGSAG